jgi:hypothetical protein
MEKQKNVIAEVSTEKEFFFTLNGKKIEGIVPIEYTPSEKKEYTEQEAYDMAIEYVNTSGKKAEIMAKFEAAFGKNAKVRTRKQWKNLVRVYGVECVSLTEHLTADELALKCNETFSQRIDRINRLRNTIK